MALAGSGGDDIRDFIRQTLGKAIGSVGMREVVDKPKAVERALLLASPSPERQRAGKSARSTKELTNVIFAPRQSAPLPSLLPLAWSRLCLAREPAIRSSAALAPEPRSIRALCEPRYPSWPRCLCYLSGTGAHSRGPGQCARSCN